MTLLPSVRDLLDQLSQGPRVDFAALNERRAIATYLEAARRPVPRPRGVDVDQVGDIVVGARNVRVRLYRPAHNSPLPALVYIHGGGWVVGDLEMHDDTCRLLANEARCIVVSVDYRLAPEYPFPVPLDDCWSALCWVNENLADRGWDGSTLAVAGSSSGGNLAAAVALRARNEGLPLALQVLYYPALDSTMSTTSWRELGQGYFLSAAQMAWYWRQYAADDAVRRRPEVSPSHCGGVEAVASALIVTAEYDPLRDEGEAYAHALRAAGVPVRLWRFSGQIHGFLSLGASLPEVREAKLALAALVGAALHGGGPAASHSAIPTPQGVTEL
jgi:acetyl esterase